MCFYLPMQRDTKIEKKPKKITLNKPSKYKNPLLMRFYRHVNAFCFNLKQ